MSKRTISGFSKLSKRGKIKWIVENFFKDPENVMRELKSYWLDNEEQQKILDGISENTISNYYLPYGVSPNFVINGKTYAVPMVTEESSVVAAASSAAKFWMQRGGFHAEIRGTQKLGHVHFLWDGKTDNLYRAMPEIRKALTSQTKQLTENMEKRGGGVRDIKIRDFSDQIPNYYQLMVAFETCESMGANFINTVLEEYARILSDFISCSELFAGVERDIDVIMSILTNYTPDSLVRVWVECPVQDLGPFRDGMDPFTFANRFCKAVKMAQVDPYRAATHNKGIFNGIDAIALATANDFRAIEANGHAYASRDGQYRGLSTCQIHDGTFHFEMTIPLAIGTVGGLTSLHPIARRSFELLGNPSAEELMMIFAATGLAQNFAAVRSLTTTGIQHGHMKMHLHNILVRMDATPDEMERAKCHFGDQVISTHAVRAYLEEIRKGRQKEKISVNQDDL